MRPRLITAENVRGVARAGRGARAASMRPRLITAENPVCRSMTACACPVLQ